MSSSIFFPRHSVATKFITKCQTFSANNILNQPTVGSPRHATALGMDKERSKTLSMKIARRTECIRVSIYLDLNLQALGNHQMQISGWKGMAEVSEAAWKSFEKSALFLVLQIHCQNHLCTVFFCRHSHHVPIDFSITLSRNRAYTHKGAVIIAANHTSHIDPFTIISGTDDEFTTWQKMVILRNLPPRLS